MAKVSVYNIEGNQVGEMELNDAIFGVEVNNHLVHMAVVNHLASNVREHRVQKLVLKFPAAERNLGDRREQVMQDRVRTRAPSGQAAA